MSGLLDFFTKEAGQKRRAWLDEKDAELTGLLSYFAGPHASDAAGKAGGLLATVSDAADYQDYVGASRDIVADPNLGNLAALATAGTALMVPGVSARMAEGAVDFGQDLARFGREEEGALNYTRKVAAKYPGAKVDISGSPARGYTINRIVVPEAERGQGIGSDIMRDILRAADDEGATVSLTPSGDFGGSVSRLKKFYKKFGFVENKGRNRDFAISEGMYRPASGKNQ